MYTYRNDKGATIQIACEISGGGWSLVTGQSKTEKDTRTEEVKDTKAKGKKKE